MSSPYGYPPGPPSAGPVAPGPRRVPIWLIIGGAVALAAVVVVAVVVVVVAARGPSREPSGPDFQRLLRAPVQPMPAQGPELSTAPSECGISPATLERVVPKRDSDNKNTFLKTKLQCSWSSGHDRKFVSLSVDIGVSDDTTTGPAGSLNHELEALTKETPLKVVAHLGDEAYAHYRAGNRNGEATVVMRAGNTVTKVGYYGSRDRPDEALPESQLMPSALQVAQEVAKGLGVSMTEKPAITDIPEDQPAVSATKGACAAVSSQTRQRMLDRQSLGPKQLGSVDFMFAPVHDSPRTGNCYWYGKAAKLTVETMTLADPPEGAGAQADRTLDWLQRKIRKEGISGTTKGNATLFALTGRGDGAFAAYEPSSSLDRDQGLVVFRIQNAVIKVTYEAGSDQELTREQAINGAYTAAVEVAATFKP